MLVKDDEIEFSRPGYDCPYVAKFNGFLFIFNKDFIYI